MSTFSFTHSATFTVTHARHLASKIAADLNACSRLHGRPAISSVESYNEELVELLRYGYLSQYEFGFKRNEMRVLSWLYEVDASGSISSDDRAGKMSAYIDLSGTAFFNFLCFSDITQRLVPSVILAAFPDNGVNAELIISVASKTKPTPEFKEK